MTYKKKSIIFDIVIISVLLLLAVILGLIFNSQKTTRGQEASIYSAGTLMKTVNLSDDDIFNIQSEGYNYKIEVCDGRICISEADCPNGRCVKEGCIESCNEAIVCAPGNLSIKIIGNDEVTDATTY